MRHRHPSRFDSCVGSVRRRPSAVPCVSPLKALFTSYCQLFRWMMNLGIYILSLIAPSLLPLWEGPCNYQLSPSAAKSKAIEFLVAERLSVILRITTHPSS